MVSRKRASASLRLQARRLKIPYECALDVWKRRSCLERFGWQAAAGACAAGACAACW